MEAHWSSNGMPFHLEIVSFFLRAAAGFSFFLFLFCVCKASHSAEAFLQVRRMCVWVNPAFGKKVPLPEGNPYPQDPLPPPSSYPPPSQLSTHISTSPLDNAFSFPCYVTASVGISVVLTRQVNCSLGCR